MTEECPICGKECETYRGMKVHKAKSHGEPYHDKETLQQLYHEENMSQTEIAEKFGVVQDVIKHHMQKLNVEADKSHGDPTKPVNHHFRERPSRPVGTCEEVIDTSHNDERVCVKVHRLIAYACGKLTLDEFVSGDKKVHHKSGHGWDNRPENLEAVTQEEHRKRHAGGSYRT